MGNIWTEEVYWEIYKYIHIVSINEKEAIEGELGEIYKKIWIKEREARNIIIIFKNFCAPRVYIHVTMSKARKVILILLLFHLKKLS